MNSFLPEALPPVHYFLMELNNERWLTLFRVSFGVLIVITALIYFRYRKRLPRDGGAAKKKRKK
jgi:hypothetical protein